MSRYIKFHYCEDPNNNGKFIEIGRNTEYIRIFAENHPDFETEIHTTYDEVKCPICGVKVSELLGESNLLECS